MVSLVELDLSEHASHDELSRGQRQRFGTAKSLAIDPTIEFQDKLFSLLDPIYSFRFTGPVA